jgi:hypothetical protein
MYNYIYLNKLSFLYSPTVHWAFIYMQRNSPVSVVYCVRYRALLTFLLQNSRPSDTRILF